MRKFISTDKLPSIVFISIIIVIWEMSVNFGWVDAYTLPAPSNVITALFLNFNEIKVHIMITLQEASIGFISAILLSILLALLMDLVPVIKRGLYPILIVSQTVPIIVLAPLFGMWFGFGILPKIVIVILVCFFPIVISLLDGIDSVDIDTVNLIQGMGANSFQSFKFIKFPASLTGLFSGLRIAATYSIMGAVIGEWLGGTGGLGVYMLRVRHSFALDKMFAAILIIVLLSILVFKSISLLQRVFMPWVKE